MYTEYLNDLLSLFCSSMLQCKLLLCVWLSVSLFPPFVFCLCPASPCRCLPYLFSTSYFFSKRIIPITNPELKYYEKSLKKWLINPCTKTDSDGKSFCDKYIPKVSSVDVLEGYINNSLNGAH